MKRIVSGLLAIITAMAISVPAFAATSRDPDPNGQNKDHWCWAAAAKMTAEHNGGQNPNISRGKQLLTDINAIGLRNPFYGYETVGGKTKYYADGVQYAIVKYIFGNDYDNSGSDSNSVAALQYASANNMNVGAIGYYKDQLSDENIAAIQNDLTHGKYVIGTMTTEKYTNSHSIVLLSYSEDIDEYAYFDPYTGETKYVDTTQLFKSYGTSYGGGSLKGRVSWYKYCR